MRPQAAALHAVRDEHDRKTHDLVEVLANTTIDEHDQEQHGLAWWYPQITAWGQIRSVGGNGGAGFGSAPPLNLDATDFTTGCYWVGTDSQDRASDADLADGDNYRPGFEQTVLGLEQSVRITLGLPPADHRRTTGASLQPQPAVVAAIEWLTAVAPSIAGKEFIYELVRSEAIRLIVRARGMMHGSRWSAGRGPCTHCHQPESVISDEDRAVCVNPVCRNPQGGRWCWSYDQADGWVEVPEPDVRGRGQVSEEQLSRWSQVA